MKALTSILMALICISLMPPEARALRLKDVAHLKGVRDNQLIGYGIVVGLDGTGDYDRGAVVLQSLAAGLSRLGTLVDASTFRSRNAAAVMVTATLPAFSNTGSTIDVVVSSIGNARSLVGGVLLSTPLKGGDNKVYAVSQGPLVVGGFAFSGGAKGNRVTKNHPTTGRIPGGAIIERQIHNKILHNNQLIWNLEQPDFTTAVRIAKALQDLIEKLPQPSIDPAIAAQINEVMDSATDLTKDTNTKDANTDEKTLKATHSSLPSIRAINAGTILVTWHKSAVVDPVPIIMEMEQLDIDVDSQAKVVVNERTGTVVLGGNVSLGECAVSQGSLRIEIKTEYNPSQPAPFSQGQTVVVPNSQISGHETRANVKPIKATSTVADLVESLNTLGVSPRELIEVLDALHSAGALKAKIEVL